MFPLKMVIISIAMLVYQRVVEFQFATTQLFIAKIDIVTFWLL